MATAFWQQDGSAVGDVGVDLGAIDPFSNQPLTLDTFRSRTPFRQPQASALRGISGDIYMANVFDVVYIDDEPMPGVCDVKGIAQLKLDDKKSKGQHGSNLTITGYQPGPFEVVVKTWTPDQEEILQLMIDKLWNIPRLDKKPTQALKKARSISHPKLDRFNISYCVIQGVTFPETGPEPGTMVMRFKCNESKPPGQKNVTATVKGSGVSRVKEYASGQEPQNTAKQPPSSNSKNLGPGGPPAKPASGAF